MLVSGRPDHKHPASLLSDREPLGGQGKRVQEPRDLSSERI